MLNGPRIVGVSVADVGDWADPLPTGKWSQLFSALARRVNLVDTIQPMLTRRSECLNLAANFHPHRARWLAQAGFNVKRASRLTNEVGRALSAREGSYDLIVQLQTVFEPGPAPRKPFVIYTDNTFALTQRFYPEWAPLSAERVDAWLAFERRICQAALRVFTFSEFARGSVVDDYRCDPARVVAIGAGANQLVGSVAVKDYSRPRALFVGRPFGLKGGPTLLEAWAKVRERLPAAELVIAGPREVAPAGLGPGVTWLGRVDRSTLERLYCEASLFVLPSMFDAWGHVFVEAMGHGLPCIGTDCCAMPEIIDDGITGLLVPRADSEALASALLELLGDPERIRQMGATAHTRVLERLTWGHVADRLLAAVPDELG